MRAARIIPPLAGLLCLIGCGGTEPEDSTGIRVAVTTSGSELDPDGYGVVIDAVGRGNLGLNGVLVIPAAAGSHDVDLDGVAGNCVLEGGRPRSVSVTAGDVTQVDFAVGCVQSGANARYLLVGPSPVAMVPGEETTLGVGLLDAQWQPVPFASRRLFAWTSSAPQAVSVSDTGAVRVLPGATPGQMAGIRVTFDSLVGQADIYVGPPGVALHVVPSRVTMTPGGRLTLQGVVEVGAGDRFSGYLVRFADPGGAVHLTKDGCSNTDCIGAAPDHAVLFGDAPGAATVAADGGGKHADVPVTVRYASFVSVTAGGGHSCGETTDGALFCWGGGFARTPLAVDHPSGLHDIQAGVDETCGLDPSGSVVCWPVAPDPVATTVSSSVHLVQLSLNLASSCGLDEAGAAWCWGANDRGQLGDGTQTPSEVPVAVAGGHTFTTVSTGGEHACALTAAGSAYCWGFNFAGELGTTVAPPPDPCSPYQCSLTPVPVDGGHVFTQIVAGAHHTCALEPSGVAWCWGFSDKRGAGPGSDTSPPATITPVQVVGGQVFARLVGGPNHTCGLTSAGLAYCWGSDGDGRTGQPPGTVPNIGLDGFPVVLTPTLVAGGHSFLELDAGGAHTCGRAADGVYCWGENGTGQVGIFTGSTEQPVRVTGQP